MKHSICGFNHAALIINFKLNYDDAQILDCIVKFRDTGKMDTVMVGGKQYFWVCYNWLLDELPGLQCSNKRTLARWMGKYVENGLMEKHVLAGNRTYYRFIPEALNNLQSYPVLQSTTPVSKIVTPVLQSTTPCTPEYNPPVLQSTTIDPSSIYQSTKISDNISESAPNGGNNTKPLSGISCNSKGSLEPKKEESSGKEERKLTDAEILFNFWVSNKGLVQHRSLTTTMEKVLKARLSEEGIDRLLESIKNYNTVLTSDNYFYSYPHNLDDFFRNGTIQKVPPYRNFLPESKPFEKFLKHKKYSSGYNQQAQEEPETDPRVEQERFTEIRALNRLSDAVRKFKGRSGEDPKKWVDFFCFARPADKDNAFLRWVWDMAIKGIPFTEEIFNQIHNRIVAESGLTYDTFEAARDEIFKR